MRHGFDDAAVAGVLAHMNGDHDDDNLLIARAYAPDADIVAATMIGFDGAGGEWRATLATGEETFVRVPWPGGSITERREVRREIVALYDESCRRLGIAPRAHD
ncbi:MULTISPECIES: DUF2470 domain-containing protein [unclassified Microbacterium]|uniref:DUF2470 domain-containing protein n=1 Tax=unclassified Microbacterium TaxID=2609290 RepID=UPI00214BD6B3|nr:MULTISPECIES: DUF2470 domain-containing protein [unclassified Microbacterium]MCR2808365.1 DUF2470 domain-containing protein [Microbacterium sp. zg.B185]WIM19187.1 DUF2470 domain-containing protein [Microbacterium sp. zg-B185]